MKAVLDASWHWDRIESQFRRGGLHTHGTLKMKNDHALVSNSKSALMGFLAAKKLKHLELLEEKQDASWLQCRKHLFSDIELRRFTDLSSQHVQAMRESFLLDQIKNPTKHYQWYLGVSCETTSTHPENVRSGEAEKCSAKKH